MDITELVERATEQAALSGFTVPGHPRSIAEHVALITTEVGEVYEAYRDGMAPAAQRYEHADGVVNHHWAMAHDNDEKHLGKPVGIPSELADIVIRVANMCGEYGIDLERVITEKLYYNATRPHMHGRKH